MPLFSSYCDVNDFLNNGLPNSEMASLTGMNTTIAGTGALLGATSLQVAATAGAPASPTTFQAWILDGAQSEYVTASVTDGTHLSVPAGTLAAHAAGVSVSSSGVSGCLASLIANASALIETLCKQGFAGGDRSLWQQSRTDKLGGPTLRAAFDVDGNLTLHPYHFPVASAASCTVQMGPQTVATIDLTYQYFPSDASTIVVPWAQTVTVQPGVTSWLIAPYPRWYQFVANLTYTAGPCAGTTLSSVPQAIKEAAYLLVMDRLGFRINPIGAANLSRGDERYETRLRGDTSGKSLLAMQALEYLRPYTARW